MQMVITSGVTAFLMALQTVPLEYLHEVNSELLRKTSARGAKYCGLNDACLVFKVNLVVFVTVFSVGLGIIAALSSLAIKRSSSNVECRARNQIHSSSVTGSSAPVKDNLDELTSFENNCLGSSFKKLFRDCDDMAYVVYKGKRCTTVEALLFTGYLYFGNHIYQASSVMLLLVT
ncbi:hypothetical protein PRIC1_012648 [Phytophthora ramorum]